MSFISQKLQQFTYFDQQLQHPHWRNKTVLDFGGNIGNILQDPAATIEHKNYWCLDVSAAAIAKGKELYPEANWVFYNRYNFSFNPTGIVDLELPPIIQDLDIILAYSVFTHIDQTEMLELAPQLESRLSPGGILAFTFIDPHFNSGPSYMNMTNLQWRLAKARRSRPSLRTGILLKKAKHAHYCTLVNECDIYVDDEFTDHDRMPERQSHHTYYTVNYMQTLFPQAEIRPPVNNETQHCCILRKALVVV
ncbi:class I SAM-dependent methyltransferase [Candidatus Entotheonella palauensis]|uniref:class I SAM-dependent methyltransferase n=1 Tax=Candidatus Entotheonella palauensis TaxID=93172 RepID=UPI000B7EC3A8|nr:class I SAM-dependent methyltransferase [Candidatus Entotheonella palauensis]